ncbi:N-acetyltransferase [Streptomyces sp. HPF1205]|uniref:N-acetyltransferase n=1 Tax=Streptomyces sp. HPF1205 TaxID=2873262 RepID=UPI001CECD2A7|nr:N-acetyltransferase [Streptomyces sp. HPF1205]
MRVVHVQDNGPLLESLYTDVLAPSFPPDELETAEWLRSGVADGTVLATAAVDSDGAAIGAAIGHWLPGARTLLLTYLAVPPGSRGGGIGGLLFSEVTGTWQKRLRPRATFAEIEHPLAHSASADYGDPSARLRFYARHGARALDIPYFQPSLRPGSGRVYGLLLAVFSLAPECAGARAGTVTPDLVRSFLEGGYYQETALGLDPASLALRRALDRPEGIPLLPLTEPERLPVSRPA